MPADFLVKDPLKEVAEKLKEVDEQLKKKTGNSKETNKHYKEQQHKYILNDMPSYLVHEVDFSKFTANAVYNFADNLAQRNDIAGIQSSSFIAKLKKAIEQHQKDSEYYRIDQKLCKAMTIQQLTNFKSCDDSNVITALFKKKYYSNIAKENIELMTNEEKY